MTPASHHPEETGGPGLVSVVIPFFRPDERFLREAVESVVAQTYLEWELILVDDGSEPCAGVSFAHSCAAAMPGRVRVVTYERPGNRGLSAARNEGVRHARGTFVTFLDADDVFLPHKLEIEVRALRQHAEARMVCTNTRYWHGWQGPLHSVSDFVPSFGSPGLVEPPGPLAQWLSGRRAVPATCSLMVRRDALTDSLAFETAFTGLFEDQVFLARFCMRHPIVLVDEVTACYRQHPVSMCASAGPEKTRRARRAYLAWLEGEAAARGMSNPSLMAAIERETWLVDHPRLGRALRMVRRRLAGSRRT